MQSVQYFSLETIAELRGRECGAPLPASLPFPVLCCGTGTAERPGGGPGAEVAGRDGTRSSPGSTAGKPAGAFDRGRSRAQPGPQRLCLCRPLAAVTRHHRAFGRARPWDRRGCLGLGAAEPKPPAAGFPGAQPAPLPGCGRWQLLSVYCLPSVGAVPAGQP